MNSDFSIIIPARFQSTRLPGKLLMEIDGKTVIERVYCQALKARAKRVIIATDHNDIYQLAKTFGAEVYMTQPTHQSGTDRVAEVISLLKLAEQEIIVNVQGDEPLIQPELINQVADCLKNASAPVATLCWPIQELSLCTNPNVVKVVRNRHHHALYFSRSLIPAHRDQSSAFPDVYRHIGLYAYRAGFLQEFVRWPVCAIEAAEALEQLRVLWMGYPIVVEEACVEPLQDINTQEDLDHARQHIHSVTDKR